MRETKHLFLRQSELKDDLNAWIDSKKDWPILTTSIAKKWLHDGDGLQDRGITRDLDWGIPVKSGDEDWPGMEGKVFYVWFDAPIEYIASAEEWAEQAGSEPTGNAGGAPTRARRRALCHSSWARITCRSTHSASRPRSWARASRGRWSITSKSFNYLNYDGGQFSTSQGRGVFMDQALELLPPDYWRWWLLSHAPESSDSEFTWENFQQSVNKDLADVLGNFVSRVTKFCRSKFDETVPAGGAYGAVENALIADLQKRPGQYEEHMEAMEVRKAAAELRAIWTAGNEYLQTVAPWSTFKEDPEQAAAQIRLALNLVAFYATLSAPFIPDASATLLETMNATDAAWPTDVAASLGQLPVGHAFTVPEVSFAKISDEQREDWQERFAGQRA